MPVYPSPTPEEYAVVRKVWEQTGILTVKDRVTGMWLKPQERCGGVAWERPWQDAPEYGADHRPKAVGGDNGFASLTIHRRAVRGHGGVGEHFGTPQLPKGVVVGGVEKWRPPDVFGRQTLQITGWQSDLGPDEEDRLRRWAYGIHHVTDEEYRQLEATAEKRRQSRTETQVDPAGALVRALAPALAELAAGRSDSPSDDALKAAGFVKVDGKWTRELAGAGKK